MTFLPSCDFPTLPPTHKRLHNFVGVWNMPQTSSFEPRKTGEKRERNRIENPAAAAPIEAAAQGVHDC